MFKSLSPGFLRMLSLEMKTAQYLPEQIVSDHNDYKHCMYFVTRGELKVRLSHRYTTEIPDFYTTLCNGVVSYGAKFGGLWVFANHTRKSKCVHDLLAQRFTLGCLHAHTAVHAVNPIHLTNHDYFDYRKNLKTPKLSPMQGSRWLRFWYLWCISVDYLPHQRI